MKINFQSLGHLKAGPMQLHDRINFYYKYYPPKIDFINNEGYTVLL